MNVTELFSSDSMCSGNYVHHSTRVWRKLTAETGLEHQADATGPAQPSYCNLDLFHPPMLAGQAPPGGIGYISRDGHHFSCRNPAQMQQAFHVYVVSFLSRVLTLIVD